MAVDEKTVAKIAHLARIRIDQDQATALAGELSNILTWVEQLNELETEGVEPMTSVVAMKPTLRNAGSMLFEKLHFLACRRATPRSQSEQFHWVAPKYDLG